MAGVVETFAGVVAVPEPVVAGAVATGRFASLLAVFVWLRPNNVKAPMMTAIAMEDRLVARRGGVYYADL